MFNIGPIDTKLEDFVKLDMLFQNIWVLCCLSHNIRTHTQALTVCNLAIDLMHNDVNNALAARTCIVVVVVTHESNMASYFPKAGNLNGSNADICSDVAGPSSSGSGDLFEPSDRS